MKKVSLLIIVLFATIRFTTAQNYEQNNYLSEKLKEIINEKLKPGTEEDALHENEYLPQLKKEIASENEKQVVKSLNAESEVHAAINPTDSNNIVLCPIKYTFQGLILPIYYTNNFGQTWNVSSFVPFPKDSGAKVVGGGDPVFVFDGNGRLFFSWIDLYYITSYSNAYWAMFWAYSDDSGKTWTKPANDIIGFSKGDISQYKFDEVYDKQWMAVDMSNSPYKNTVYISYYKVQMTSKKERIVLKKKRPDKDFFDSMDVSVSDSTFKNVQFTNIVVDAHGHVHIIFWGSKDGSSFGVWHSVSTNGGENFSTPNLISDAQKLTNITGIKTSRLYPCTQLASDPVNSALYATWTSTGTTSAGTNGAEIYFSRSTDEGLTWSIPIIVNDDQTGSPKDQFYSSIAVNSKGIISLSWYDGRYSSSKSTNEDVRYYMAKSKNGGLSFEKNFYISTNPSDFGTVGDKNNSFGIGEYTQMLTTNSYAIPVWSDGRKGNGDLDIYVGFVNLDSNFVGLHDINLVTDMIAVERIFPNPASDLINIKVNLNNSSDLFITIFDMQGKEIRNFNQGKLLQGTHNLSLNVAGLNAGKYVMLFESDFGYISRSFSIIRNFK